MCFSQNDPADPVPPSCWVNLASWVEKYEHSPNFADETYQMLPFFQGAHGLNSLNIPKNPWDVELQGTCWEILGVWSSFLILSAEESMNISLNIHFCNGPNLPTSAYLAAVFWSPASRASPSAVMASEMAVSLGAGGGCQLRLPAVGEKHGMIYIYDNYGL